MVIKDFDDDDDDGDDDDDDDNDDDVDDDDTVGPRIRWTQRRESHLGRRRFRNNEEVEMHIREWLRKQEPHITGNEIRINFCQVEINASTCLGD